ncbi:unnamed protein product [Moneuplotes crassus]|uniref:Uncharacterized protein n=1 Tax=Euplotes crassus TaxID=5936 RepID=A0AAD1X812_EUPCR|nr:unnamed protein product [Moneuplotes crassus]
MNSQDREIGTPINGSLKLIHRSHHDLDEDKNGVFPCLCLTCSRQTLKSFGNVKISRELKEYKINARHKIRHKALSFIKQQRVDFLWLIQHLFSPHHKVRNCHIRLPDTVFFRKGKIVLRVKSDANDFLHPIRNPKKLKTTEIRSNFPTITRERRKRNQVGSTLDMMEEEEEESRAVTSTIKTNKIDVSSISFSKGEAYKEFNLPQGKTLHGNFYRDIAIIQYYNQEGAYNNIQKEEKQPFISKIYKPVSENEFLRVMTRRPNDDYWKKIEFIQTCVKAKKGIGENIKIDFYSRISKEYPMNHIVYNFRKFKADQWLMKHNPKEYCRKQVIKMCYYISKLYNYEILRMQCTFLADDDGLIWFSKVENCFVRVKPGCQENSSIFDMPQKDSDSKRESSFTPQFHFNYIHGELQQLEEKERKTTEKRIHSLSTNMLSQFEQFKKESTVMDYLEEKNDYKAANEAIKELYPDRNFTLKDVLANDSYSSKNLNSFSFGEGNPPKTSKVLSKSMMEASSKLSHSKSKERSVITDFGIRPDPNMKKSTSLAQITGNKSELLNLLPDLGANNHYKSIDDPKAKYANPLGLRRLGVYKHRFSISSKSRATGPTSRMSYLQSNSMASDRTARFALSIPYE